MDGTVRALAQENFPPCSAPGDPHGPSVACLVLRDSASGAWIRDWECLRLRSRPRERLDFGSICGRDGRTLERCDGWLGWRGVVVRSSSEYPLPCSGRGGSGKPPGRPPVRVVVSCDESWTALRVAPPSWVCFAWGGFRSACSYRAARAASWWTGSVHLSICVGWCVDQQVVGMESSVLRSVTSIPWVLRAGILWRCSGILGVGVSFSADRNVCSVKQRPGSRTRALSAPCILYPRDRCVRDDAGGARRITSSRTGPWLPSKGSSPAAGAGSVSCLGVARTLLMSHGPP